MSQFNLALPTPEGPQIDMADRVRPKLDAVLDGLRAHGGAEWSARELRRYRLIVPQMCRWLPEVEADATLRTFRRLAPDTVGS